jgi:hypothetical protein
MGKRILNEARPNETRDTTFSPVPRMTLPPRASLRNGKQRVGRGRSNGLAQSPEPRRKDKADKNEDPTADLLQIPPPASKVFRKLDDTSDDEAVETDEELKYHLYITNQYWDELKRLLKKYDTKYYKRMREKAEQELEQAEKEESQNQGDSPRKKWGNSLRTSLKRASISRFRVAPCKVISPLLICDRRGRTPLHLACMRETPGQLLVDLIDAEKTASAIQDYFGRTPLHYAAQAGQGQIILEALVQAYPNAMKTRDEKERTPLWFAVQYACRQARTTKAEGTNGDSFCWRTPMSEEEKDWQFHQQKNWSNVDYFLQQFVKRKRALVSFDYDLILQGLECGAAPDTIKNFIAGGEKFLKSKDDLAGSAIILCIERQYDMVILEHLLDSCRERATVITESMQKALVSHYRKGHHPQRDGTISFGKQMLAWMAYKKGNQPIGDEEEEVLGGLTSIEEEDSEVFHDKSDSMDEICTELSPACRDWWERLRYLLFYSCYGAKFGEKDSIQDVYLVHAALAVPVSPPSLIQLLILLYPESRSELCPIYKALPVHISCTRWKYGLLQVESNKSQPQVLKQLLKGLQNQICRRHSGRLPLHLALAVGQHWSFVRLFLSMDKKSVGMRDPITKLFPFQMAALKIQAKNIKMHLRSRNTPEQWMNSSESTKRTHLRDAERVFECKQVETVFELLRSHPNAILGKALHRKPSFEGVGPISKHYLSLAYIQTSKGWKPFPAAIKLLKESIVNARIARELQSWWETLKVMIWDYPSVTQLPKTERYLLHAALYNPDTPPLIIQLLLELFPESASIPVPQSESYPLHIAAGTTNYQPQPFEIPFSTNGLHLVLLAYDDAAYMFSCGRLPIHICIAGGKTWDEIGPLAQDSPLALHVADERSQLMPFQQMATFKATSKENSLRFSLKVERCINILGASQLSGADRGKLLKTIYKKHDLDVLSSIFSLVRKEPSVLHAFIKGSFRAVPENNRQVIMVAKAKKREALEKFVRDMESSSSRDLLAMPFPSSYGQMRTIATPIDELAAFSNLNTSGRSLISGNSSLGSYV